MGCAINIWSEAGGGGGLKNEHHIEKDYVVPLPTKASKALVNAYVKQSRLIKCALTS